MKKMFDVYPFGVTYQHWPDPNISRDEWPRDLANIRKYELNHVWFALNWADVEKQEGEFDLTESDRRIELARKNNLKVHLVLEGYRGGGVEPPPDWFMKKHGDVYVVPERMRGTSRRSSGPTGQRVCQNHPAVKEGITKFFEAVAKHYRDNDSILLYNIYWEPRFVCSCRHCVNEFKKWLKNKYGSIEGLQKAWAAPYITDWESVMRFRSTPTYSTSILDWRAFCLYNVANFIGFGANALRNKDPNHPVLTHPILSMITLGSMIMSGVDDWLIAKSVDIFGNSYYPTIPTGRGPLRPALEAWIWAETIDGLRCAAGEKPLFIAELQTHYYSRLRPIDRMRPEEISLICWHLVAHGCKGITFWKWRPFLRGAQVSGRGLTLHDGTPSRRAEVVREVGLKLKQYSDIFLGMEPAKAETAILFNPMNYAKFLALAQRGSIEYPVSSINGVYRALWESNIPVDFVRPEDIREGKLQAYKILYIPLTMAMDQDVASSIKAFVEDGGVAVADACCAVTDDFDLICYQHMPGAGLGEVFKCREIDLYAGKDFNPGEPYCLTVAQPHSGISLSVSAENAAMPRLRIGDSMSGSLYREVLEVHPGGEVIARFADGTPAIVSASYGKGKTAFVGTSIGRSYIRYMEKNVQRLLSGFAEWAGVRRPVEILENAGGRPVEVQLHSYKGSKILFATNFGESASALKLGVRLPQTSYDCFDMIADREVSSSWERNLLRLDASIGPLKTTIYKITPK